MGQKHFWTIQTFTTSNCLQLNSRLFQRNTSTKIMPYFLQGKYRGEGSSASKALCSICFLEFGCYLSENHFHGPIRKLFTSLLPLANLLHIKKYCRNMYSDVFFHNPKRVLPRPDPERSQTSEPQVKFASPPSVRLTSEAHTTERIYCLQKALVGISDCRGSW